MTLSAVASRVPVAAACCLSQADAAAVVSSKSSAFPTKRPMLIAKRPVTSCLCHRQPPATPQVGCPIRRRSASSATASWGVRDSDRSPGSSHADCFSAAMIRGGAAASPPAHSAIVAPASGELNLGLGQQQACDRRAQPGRESFRIPRRRLQCRYRAPGLPL